MYSMELQPDAEQGVGQHRAEQDGPAVAAPELGMEIEHERGSPPGCHVLRAEGIPSASNGIHAEELEATRRSHADCTGRSG